ncbi:MFS transporter [Streptomyces flavidovirens]|uniref:MFS transporter n=1 Tax=Streptomyces flavidovirens TaxID=67298 RepID=UPI00068609E2|nr:MFS transporter [Streptomyces flavidovirens]
MTAQRMWAACAVTGVAVFLCGLDHLVLLTAMPAIRVTFAAQEAALGWLVNAYILPVAVLPPFLGVLAERCGRRRVFTCALWLFTTGSAAAACAPGISLLIAARLVQGVGAAAITPLSLTLVTAVIPPRRRPAMLGVWGALGAVAIAVGPFVGGAVLMWGGWRHVFWLNLPLGCILALAARRCLPGDAEPAAGARRHSSWHAPRRLIGRLPGCPRLWHVHACGFLLHAAVFGTVLYLVQFPQEVQEENAWEAGWRILPWTALPVLIAPLAGAVMGRTGARAVLAAGCGLTSVSCLWFALVLEPDTPYLAQLPGLVAGGAGMALFFTAAPQALVDQAPPARLDVASGFNTSSREAGAMLGVAIASALFAQHAAGLGPVGFTGGLTAVCWAGAVLAAAATAAAVLVPASAASADAAPASAEEVTERLSC